jgi:hypothetical protein
VGHYLVFFRALLLSVYLYVMYFLLSKYFSNANVLNVVVVVVVVGCGGGVFYMQFFYY